MDMMTNARLTATWLQRDGSQKPVLTIGEYTESLLSTGGSLRPLTSVQESHVPIKSSVEPSFPASLASKYLKASDNASLTASANTREERVKQLTTKISWAIGTTLGRQYQVKDSPVRVLAAKLALEVLEVL